MLNDNVSTDDNDIFMCDHKGCGRMMHMKCFDGKIDPDEKEDWFCLYCDTLCDLLDYIERQYNEYYHDNISIDDVQDVVNLFSKCKVSSSSDDEIGSSDDDYESSESLNGSNDEYSNNDSDSEAADEGLTAREINHLKKDMTLDESRIFESDDVLERRAYREKSQGLLEDMGKFTEENIVSGKRKRAVVDYETLNYALFGLKNNDKELDDIEDYIGKGKSKL